MIFLEKPIQSKWFCLQLTVIDDQCYVTISVPSFVFVGKMRTVRDWEGQAHSKFNVAHFISALNRVSQDVILHVHSTGTSSLCLIKSL